MRLMSLIKEEDDRTVSRNKIFENILPKITTLHSDDVPIAIKKSKWERSYSPEYLSRTFSFNGQAQVLRFIVELLRYERKNHHNAVITIDHDEVTVVLRTSDLDKVTDMDIEYAKECDFIFEEMF